MCTFLDFRFRLMHDTVSVESKLENMDCQTHIVCESVLEKLQRCINDNGHQFEHFNLTSAYIHY